MTAKDQSDAKEMKPTVYIETTIPSLLTAWPNRDVEILAQQVATRERWEAMPVPRVTVSQRWPSAEFLPPPARPRR